MAKYLSYEGLGTLWGQIRNYFPTVKNVPSGGTLSLNSGVATGNIAVFSVDTNNYVSLTGISASFSPSDHGHGSITNAGAITGSGTALANGDYLVFADASDSNKLKKSSITIGTGTTTYLRNDGTWATPANTATLKVSDTSNKKISTNESSTAYIQFTGGSNKFTVKDGTNQFDVAITPSITNNITGSGTSGQAAVFNGTNTLTGRAIATSLSSDSSTSLTTEGAVVSYVSSQLGTLTGALKYKGTIGSSGATVSSLPASHSVGDVYVVSVAGTYAGKACEVGDYIVCHKDGTTATDTDWDVLNGENQVSQSNSSFTTDASSKAFAVVDGTTLNLAVTHHTPSGAASGTAGTTSATSGYEISIPYITTDAKGHVTGKGTHTHTVSPGNAKLQVKGSGSGATATDTGFTADATSAGCITFAKTGGSISSITTSGGTVTINGVDTLANPNSLKIGTKPSASGTATDVITYDGSGAKTLYFSTAAASTTNVKFAIDSNGYITGTVTDSGNTNTATLKVSDTSNRKISTTETSTAYIQFTGGTNKVTVTDGTNSFDVAITPSISSNVIYSGTLVSGNVPKWSGTSGTLVDSGYTLGKSVPSDAVFTDTKNTAGSTDSSSKLFLIGATSQAANPQTYSQDTAYVGTDGCLYSNSTKVMVSGDMVAITDAEINTVCVLS